jgi:hypothetical protein
VIEWLEEGGMIFLILQKEKSMKVKDPMVTSSLFGYDIIVYTSQNMVHLIMGFNFGFS